MTSPTPIIIGQYCADFLIEQPSSSSGYYYYKTTISGSGDYYISTARATNGTVAADGSGTDTIRIIPSPFVVPASGSVEDTNVSANYDNNFREFRFKLTWKPSFTPDFTDSAAVVASNRRRYLEWKDPSTGTSGSMYTDSKKDRFVQISADNDMLTGVKFGPSALNDNTIFPASSSSASTSIIKDTGLTASVINKTTTGLTFSATTDSPVIQTRSSNLKYLILKTTYDDMSASIVTASKSLKYLIYNNGRLELVDLYDPDVTTSVIQKTAYRLAKDTTANLPSITGDAVLTSSPSQTWSITAYTGSSSVGLTVSGTGASAFPSGFAAGSTGIKASKDIFSSFSGGFPADKFTTTTSSNTALDDAGVSRYLTDPQDLVVTFNSGQLTYADMTNNFGAGSGIAASASTTTMQFVFTSLLVDKTVEELFTNLNVTLLKVQSATGTSSPSISPISQASGNLNFLGFENTHPSSTPAVVTSSITSSGQAHTGSGTTAVELIVRDYYKFFSPARATQFKFYDLGKGTEYLWQVKLPSGSADTYAYVGINNGTITYYPSSYVTQNTRGWIMEYITSMTPPGVRMRWAEGGSTAGSDYVGLTSSGAITDSNPYRVKATLVPQAQAAIFNCIMCSSIDSTGACLPISSGYDGTNIPSVGRPNGIITTISVTGISPSVIGTTAIFKFATVTGSVFGFTVTQIASGRVVGSPGSGVFSPGAQPASFITYSPIPSPVPSGTVFDFVITQAGGVISKENNARKAVFIRANGAANQYLKYTAAGSNRIELISSNRPSDDDGFAWILFKAPASPSTTFNPRRVVLYSAYTSGSPSATRSINRYLQPGGGLGASATAQVFTLDGLTDTEVERIWNT